MTSSDFVLEDYLTPSQLVERWKDTPFPVSLVTLARWRRANTGPAFIKAGHKNARVYYFIKAVEVYEHGLVPDTTTITTN